MDWELLGQILTIILGFAMILWFIHATFKGGDE